MKLFVPALLAALAAPRSPQQEAVVPASQQQTVAALRPSGIAARINGEIITWDAVEFEIQNVPLAQRTPDLRRDMLRTLAEKELFLQEAKNYNIEITEQQVDSVLESDRKKSGFSVEEFQKKINSDFNQSITEYRTFIKRELTIGTLMSRLATEPLRNPNPKLRLLFEFVSPEEMRDYFTEHPEQFRAINQVDLVFLTFQFSTPEERDLKVRLAESIRRRVKEGSNLYVLALAYMDPNLMSKKGETRMPAYVNLARGESPFSPETTQFIFSDLKKGETSEPRVEGNSVTLFHLQDKIEERKRTFEEAQPFIRKQLEGAKRRTNQKLLRDDLVRRSFVVPTDLFN